MRQVPNILRRAKAVRSAHSVPDGFILLNQRLVVLRVLTNEVLAACIPAARQEPLRKAEVAGIPSCAVEIREAKLDFRMAIDIAALAGSKCCCNQISILYRDVQEVPLAGCVEMGDGRFIEMPDAVELVACIHRFPALCPTRRQVVRIPDGLRGIEIAIRFLSLGDQGDDGIHAALDLSIPLYGEDIRGAFDGFIDIRVVEAVPLTGLRGRVAEVFATSGAEVAKSTGFLTLFEDVWESDIAVAIDARFPEGIPEGDLCMKNRR